MNGTEETLPRTARIVLVLAILFGSFLRIDGFARQALAGDEIHAAPQVVAGFGEILTTFDRNGSHIGFPMLQRLAGEAFGLGVMSYRLPAVLAGILGLLVMFPIARRWIGTWPAWIATLVLSVHPLHIYYSRNARTYSLVFLLTLLLVASLWKALPRGGTPWPWRWRVAVAALVAVLPYLHLSSTGVLLGTGAASLVLAWRVRGRRMDLVTTASVFLAGALVSLALYLPAWSGGFADYVGGIGNGVPGAPRIMGVLMYLGGGYWGGVALASFVLAGAVLLPPNDRGAGLLLLFGVLGPLAVLALTRPQGGAGGDTFAYTRYLMSALPFLLMLASWSIVWILERLVPPDHTDRAVLASGLLLSIGLAAGVPYLRAQVRHGCFTNDQLAMQVRPAYDVPFARMPAFYRQIAESEERLTVIEFPVPPRAFRMMRNYELQHGQDALVGLYQPSRDRRAVGRWLKERKSDELLVNGPYVLLKAPRLRRSRDVADYLIVHTDIETEVSRYNAFANNQTRQHGQRSERLLRRTDTEERRVSRARKRAEPAIEQPEQLFAMLDKVYGAAVYEDDLLRVWKIEP